VPKYRWMVCPRCEWGSKVYGHADPYYCPKCGDEGGGIDSVLKEKQKFG